jgi:acyl carrier protein
VINDLFKFLSENYAKLPMPFRVIVYCLVLLVFIYLLLIPQYIDGELVIKDDTEGEIASDNTPISLMANGRNIKMTTNDDGMWAIPLASKLPFKSIQLYCYKLKKKYPVTIPYSKVVSGHVKVVLQEDDKGEVHFTIAEAAFPQRHMIVASAYADTTTGAGGVRPTPPDSAEIAAKVKEIICKTLNKQSGCVVRDSMRLQKDLNITDMKMPKVKYLLKKEMGFSAPGEEWMEITTVKELIDFVAGK